MIKFANSIIETLQQYIDQKNHVILAVSGGKSPVSLFEYLSNSVVIDWGKVTIILVDERVTKNLADRNSNLIQNHLLQNAASRAEFIALYDESTTLLDNLITLNNANYKPDIAILGMGLDGHTASIFPCCPEYDYLLRARAQFALSSPTTAPYQRITMTLSALLAVDKLFLFTSDPAKQQLLKQISGVDEYIPISYLLEYHNFISMI